MTAQRYVHDILQPRVATHATAPGPFFTRQCSASSWASHEFEQTRDKVTANMEQNVSRHHTELVCLNARSYRIVHLR
ncbi:hypothetical protein TNCV_275191 [Trichonephila clavipes]|nr:hypothetical protein TNCV_275191 [Trichonephila clavipes]